MIKQTDKLEFVWQRHLPLPLGEVPPQGAERALSVTAKAVPAPPKGEPRPRQIPICRTDKERTSIHLSVYCAICDFVQHQRLHLMREVARRAGGRENERLQ